jgi:hypothetical protein
MVDRTFPCDARCAIGFGNVHWRWRWAEHIFSHFDRDDYIIVSNEKYASILEKIQSTDDGVITTFMWIRLPHQGDDHRYAVYNFLVDGELYRKPTFNLGTRKLVLSLSQHLARPEDARVGYIG